MIIRLLDHPLARSAALPT